MGEQPQRSAAERLDSWKEIAAYLGRGTRTVQRWERELGLPVHRLHHEKLGSIYAYRQELDRWWNSRRVSSAGEPPAEPGKQPSIAVLAFRDMSREKDQDYFCEGIAEEIIGALSHIEGLRVASRTAAFRFKADDVNVRDAARQLGVRSLLEGSVRKSGERLRIGVKLVDAESGYQMWSATYDREMRDIFAIQAEIANQVVKELRVRVSAREEAALAKTPTSNAQAYDFYLRGRKYYYAYGKQDIECAIQLFTRAIELDGGFALAYAGLADCWAYIYLYVERSDMVRECADWASGRAVEMDPASAQVHASRGVAHSLNGRDGEAETAFETALRLDPQLYEAHYFYARHSFARGHLAKAAELYEKAIQARPEDYQAPLLVAQIYDDLGLAEKAAAARRRGIGNAEQHRILNPDDVRALYMAANGMVKLGQTDRGKRWAERALGIRPDDAMLLYNVGCIYSLLGMAQEAVTCLEKAVANGLTQRGWYEHDSNLDPLRAHPRFQKMLRRLK